jgi:hypothetical protein
MRRTRYADYIDRKKAMLWSAFLLLGQWANARDKRKESHTSRPGMSLYAAFRAFENPSQLQAMWVKQFVYKIERWSAQCGKDQISSLVWQKLNLKRFWWDGASLSASERLDVSGRCQRAKAVERTIRTYMKEARRRDAHSRDSYYWDRYAMRCRSTSACNFRPDHQRAHRTTPACHIIYSQDSVQPISLNINHLRQESKEVSP